MRQRWARMLLVALIGHVLLSPYAAAVTSAAPSVDESQQAAGATRREDEILALLLDLDLQRQALAAQIAAGEETLAQLQIDMGELQRKVRAGRAEIERQRRASSKRIGVMAQMQPVDWLDILLGAESFADFVGRWDAIGQLVASDLAMLSRLQEARRRQQGHLAALAVQFELAEWQQRQLHEWAAEAEATAAALEAELAALADERSLYEARLAALQTEWQAALPVLQSALNRLVALENHFADVEADLKLSLVPFRAVVTVEAAALEQYLAAGGATGWQVMLADNELSLQHAGATIAVGGLLRGDGDAVVWEISRLTFAGVAIPESRQSAWIERRLLRIRPAELPLPYRVATVTADRGQLVLDLRAE